LGCVLRSELLLRVWAAVQRALLLSTGGSIDGATPNQGLVSDSSGNLYGTTEEGGSVPCATGYGCGTVFELSPLTGGGWEQTVLFNFCTSTSNPKTCSEGAYPESSLLIDKKGNLYGGTNQGGIGYGVVFELSPPSVQGGSWTQAVLFTASDVNAGLYPDSQLIIDGKGNLYGTNGAGGILGGGNVFELSPPTAQGGPWTETILYTFCQVGPFCSDGQSPAGGVVFDREGNLYGATGLGGANSNGVVFELSPSQSGEWTEAVLYTFSASGQGGSLPDGSLTLDNAGNLYGVTFAGGIQYKKYCDDWTKHCGAVFRLLKKANWKEQFFQFHGFDGGVPQATPYLNETSGVVFGTTELGGTQALGTIYEINGTSETVLYNFCSQANCADGAQPGSGGSLVNIGGKLYGTTWSGGGNGYGPGTVFEFTSQ